MASKTTSSSTKDHLFEWEGKDRKGKAVRGELRAVNEQQVAANLRRQNVVVTKVRKRRMSGFSRVTAKEVSVFTRQLASMMKAGVPLLQAFDIVGRGNPNPAVNKLINDIRTDIETGTAMSAAFRKHPQHFDSLYCNMIAAGEAAGILDQMLDRLALYMEKVEGIKSKIKRALMYPVAVFIVAFIVISVIMLFVIPSFKEVFSSFGAELPLPTQMVISLSEFFIDYWWAIFGGIGVGLFLFLRAWKRSVALQMVMDRLMLRVPVMGDLVRKSVIARWTRTMSTMFAAGVPLVEALESVGGAAGNAVYAAATQRIQQEVSTGTSLTSAMINTNVFPSMVVQMSAVGEESGAIDHMLSKAAEFYEQEVDDMAAGLSSLMEPIIIVVLGTLIGGIVVAMYLPIFKMGQVV